MTVDLAFTNILVYALIFARLAGMIGFNPLFSQNNVPPRVRVALCLFITLIVAPMQPESIYASVYGMGSFLLAFALLFELGIGMVFGYVFQVFYYLLYFAGDLVDTDIGLSMAKSFDPNTSIQTGFSSSVFRLMFALYFFTSGAHLSLIYFFADTFNSLPVGTFHLSVSIISFVIRLFVRVFSIALRLVAPFMVAEFILQATMGILMKFIPQISVFVINFQLRVALGLLMMYAFSPYIGQFITNYIDTMFNDLIHVVELMT